MSSPRTGWSGWGSENDSTVGELELRGEKDPSEWREQRGESLVNYSKREAEGEIGVK